MKQGESVSKRAYVKHDWAQVMVTYEDYCNRNLFEDDASIARFCREQGLSPRSFRHFRRQLGKRP